MSTPAHRVGIALGRNGVDTFMTDKSLDAGLRKEIEELLNSREVHKVTDNGDELFWKDIKWYDFAFKEVG